MHAKDIWVVLRSYHNLINSYRHSFIMLQAHFGAHSTSHVSFSQNPSCFCAEPNTLPRSSSSPSKNLLYSCYKTVEDVFGFTYLHICVCKVMHSTHHCCCRNDMECIRICRDIQNIALCNICLHFSQSLQLHLYSINNNKEVQNVNLKIHSMVNQLMADI